jgi:hypothetical protein
MTTCHCLVQRPTIFGGISLELFVCGGGYFHQVNIALVVVINLSRNEIVIVLRLGVTNQQPGQVSPFPVALTSSSSYFLFQNLNQPEKESR